MDMMRALCLYITWNYRSKSLRNPARKRIPATLSTQHEVKRLFPICHKTFFFLRLMKSLVAVSRSLFSIPLSGIKLNEAAPPRCCLSLHWPFRIIVVDVATLLSRLYDHTVHCYDNNRNDTAVDASPICETKCRSCTRLAWQSHVRHSCYCYVTSRLYLPTYYLSMSLCFYLIR